ncbi:MULTISPECIES: CNNM domain-containing protein [unclassified Microbulbifer]|uniref:CNNM domain-containing protein n=1 Tax=Microbulbifer spongiae TaxID=2944933 RepID=A0ABY9EDE8_9GAMM|nr:MULTISPECIES: CNNM domain-containing protein [unclassified Microbulbifer]MDP5210449.1 CNNM domain-containing protein [Microbulbifer sp. 2205BS26-8]WKD49549.1 CNNM domain-containing protein [Microbulbifer sp. MI-G]
MSLLITYILIALGFSFLCSIAEAVILSVTTPYVRLLEQKGHRAGALLRKLKADINAPLAAILTLNTIAHTVGAAGAGAQAAEVFGSQYLGIASAILTLLILVFSEIIPKTLGAIYWRQLAPFTAFVLRTLVWLLYPFVKMSEWLTRGLTHGPTLTGFSRDEFAVMAEIGEAEGQLEPRESNILRNLFFTLRDHSVREVMTPRTVVFSLPQDETVGEAYEEVERGRFSRIPVFENRDPDCVVGFVLKQELLLAYAKGERHRKLAEYRRDMLMLPETATIYQAFQKMLSRRVQISAVLDEYGSLEGLVTLEDLLETLLGEEIVDEADKTPDRQELAKRLWRWRSKRYGLKVDESAQQEKDTEDTGDGRNHSDK